MNKFDMTTIEGRKAFALSLAKKNQEFCEANNIKTLKEWNEKVVAIRQLKKVGN